MDKVLECKTRIEARLLVSREVSAVSRILRKEPATVGTVLSGALLRRRILSDIGYQTGYYDSATADRILDLFETEHPLFGREHPVPELALAMGKRYGKLTKTEAGRAKVGAFMNTGDYAGLRNWIREAICPLCFALTDEVGPADCPNAIHGKNSVSASARGKKGSGKDEDSGIGD